MNQKQPAIPPPTQEEARIFCDVCQYVYDGWVTHKNIFDDLSSLLQNEKGIPARDFLKTPIGSCFHTISNNLGDNIIMEIAKLHDPARIGNNENLTIDLFIKHVEWSDVEKPRIECLEEQLSKFYGHIKEARNKILAHRAREVFRNQITLGGFAEGADEDYFQSLGELCTMIWKKFYPDTNITPYNERIRVFQFNKEGITGDTNCPAYCARTLRDLIVHNSK